MSRKEREQQQRRQDIVDAAERLFLQKGFAHVTMEQIAKESEFTRKTLYSYFKNREDLFTVVFLKISKIRWAILKEAIEKKESGYNKLWAFGDAYYHFAVQYPEYFRMGVYLDHNGMDFEKISTEVSEELCIYRNMALDDLRSAYKVGQQDGSLREDINININITHLCLSLRTMLNEIVLGYEKKEFYYEYLELFLSSLKSKK